MLDVHCIHHLVPICVVKKCIYVICDYLIFLYLNPFEVDMFGPGE